MWFLKAVLAEVGLRSTVQQVWGQRPLPSTLTFSFLPIFSQLVLYKDGEQLYLFNFWALYNCQEFMGHTFARPDPTWPDGPWGSSHVALTHLSRRKKTEHCGNISALLKELLCWIRIEYWEFQCFWVGCPDDRRTAAPAGLSPCRRVDHVTSAPYTSAISSKGRPRDARWKQTEILSSSWMLGTFCKLL